ncbi:hypothetical protein SELMODRAFT_415377 [Selaginella moellendorffii]|uniref:TauD/TfdA-like domain-containing protein n=1 Tax=Selaginella moellendorffii TaxID=88036 RepID=D8RVX6_SELML|nr:hypothetical protein SELMODRAFT_415377 [Selaginella moellendorffii]
MRGIPVGVLVKGHTPEQRSPHLFRIPHVFVPFDSSCAALSMLLEGIQSQKADIEHALHQSGAVLLRGFEVLTASDFNDVLEAFGYDNFVYNGRGAQRKAITGRVVTANEKPVHLPIGFHNEMAYQLKTPSKVPEAPHPSYIVYQRLKKEMPEFLNMVEDKGLTYIRTLCNYPSAKDSWQEILQASTKEEAEKNPANGNPPGHDCGDWEIPGYRWFCSIHLRFYDCNGSGTVKIGDQNIEDASLGLLFGIGVVLQKKISHRYLRLFSMIPSTFGMVGYQQQRKSFAAEWIREAKSSAGKSIPQIRPCHSCCDEATRSLDSKFSYSEEFGGAGRK